jgi:hypothetical protein
MKAKKILFITQEMTPFVPETPKSLMGRHLPQAIQEIGHEIRTFTPKWGVINERRNQLHEVIRLSGMNLIIDETDHPLIIKVASLQAARMQIYFIGNDDPAEAFKAIYNDPVKLGGYTLEHTSQAGAYIKANSSADVLFSFRPKSEGTYLFILYEALYDENIQLLNRPLAYCSLSTSSTGIQTIETKVEGEDTPYYNLSGQKVVPQRKGIYIHNGKKVILR